MSGKRPGTWIGFWRSFKWLFRSPSLSTVQSIAEPHPVASPLVIEADRHSSEAANLADVAARAVVASPFAPPLPVLADPSFDFEAVDLGLGASQALACILRDRAPNAAPVKAETIEIPSVPVGEDDPPAEALEPFEVAVPMQSLGPKTNFMLPARLAIVAKLNVASVRTPRYLPNRLSPGKAVPLATSVQPACVRHPQRLEAMKPVTRIMIQNRPAPSVIIDLDAVRKARQSSPVAKHAA